MKKFTFQRVKTDVKEPLLRAIIDTCLSEPMPTRASVTEATGLGATSVRKVMSALPKCGFTDEVSRPQTNGKKPCLHQALRAEVSSLVIDLSSPTYTVSIIDGERKCVLFEQYDFDRSVSLSDNLITFFSRAGLAARKIACGFCSVGVILADRRLTEKQYPDPALLSLPLSADHREALDSLIGKFFGMTPGIYADLSTALRHTLRYRILPDADPAKGLAYGYLGREAYGVCVRTEGTPILVRLSELAIDNRKVFGDLLSDAPFSYDPSKLVWRVVNLLRCISDAEFFVVESERLKITSDAHGALKQTLAEYGASSRFKAMNKAPGIAAYGMAVACTAELILSHFEYAPAEIRSLEQ